MGVEQNIENQHDAVYYSDSLNRMWLLGYFTDIEDRDKIEVNILLGNRALPFGHSTLV